MADKRKLRRIGVSFSSETGTVDDWKIMECQVEAMSINSFLIVIGMRVR